MKSSRGPRLISAMALLTLTACIGPEWSYHQEVNCQNGQSELAILGEASGQLHQLIAEKKLNASDLIVPHDKAKVLLGNGHDDPEEFFLVNIGEEAVLGGMANASHITVLDYAQALELRKNEITSTCQIEPERPPALLWDIPPQ